MRSFSLLFALSLVGAAAAQSLSSEATVRRGAAGGTDSLSDGMVANYTQSIGPFNGSAHAQADYGTLRASASADTVPIAEFAYAQGSSRFSDMITITGGTGTDTFFADWTVDGTILATGGAEVRANILWPNLPNGVLGGLTSGTATHAGVFGTTFTYGVPFSIGAELYATVSFAPGASGSGSADFFTTARLTGVRVVDESGNPVAGAVLSSASGHVYPAPVPEPASMAALGLGAAALLRRRQSR